MSALTAEWLTRAEEDYSVACGLLRRRKVPANSICFHCQQAAEKYIKAVLQEVPIRFGKTHDLEALACLGTAVAPELVMMSADLALLSDYAVKYRYSGQDATVRQARSAGAAARRVRAAARAWPGE